MEKESRMGYIRHEAIVVTSFGEEYIQKAKKFAEGLKLHTTGIVKTINGYCTFLIAPDGSKEGWIESDEHEQARKDWCVWADKQSVNGVYFDYAYISFGGDDDHCRVIQYSGKD